MSQQFFTFSGLNSDKENGDDELYGFGGKPGGGPDFATGANPLKVLNPLESAPQMRPPSQAGGLWGAPPTAGGIWGGGTGAPPGSALGAAMVGGAPKTLDNRPLSSHRKAGYSSTPQQATFDPLKQQGEGPAPPLQQKSADSPEEHCLDLERKVNTLIEESALLSLQKDFPLALEKAKEASKKERSLCKHREQQGLGDQINIDLTYSVHFNLAVQFQKNQMYTEALNTYSLIVRNKQYAQSGRLRVNMGNIYYEQSKVSLAIKMYRLALDQIPNTGKDLKFKIIRNIGNAYVKIGQYQDAISSFETIMEGGNPDIQTGFNLLLCYYALGDKEKLKRHFTKLLNIRKYGSVDDDDIDDVMEEVDKENDVLAHVDDHLRQEIRERRKLHMEILLTSARLIAPMIDRDWQTGFDYIIEQLRHYELKDASSRLASEMEMCKALQYLKDKKYGSAIEALKSFERKDKALKAKAAVNLGFLYFLEGDLENGQKYADMAWKTDKYNAKAAVNKASFHYVRQEFDKAKEMLLEGLSLEADCVEAMYNLGLTTKQLQQYEESLHMFKKLQSMIPDSVEVIYHIANLYDLMCDYHNACEWFNRLVTRVPTDPNVLARLGSIYSKEDDEPQAFHYHLEAYRYFPVNMEVISWLGAYFVKNEVYEKAMQFFERAAQIQPNEVKWQLMVASCHRRIGAYPQAKAVYEEIHKRYPDNVECLRYLVHICNDSEMKEEAVEYHKRLKKLEARMSEDDFGWGDEGEGGDEEDDDVLLRGGGSPPVSDAALQQIVDTAIANATAEPSTDEFKPRRQPVADTAGKVSTSAARLSRRKAEQEKEMQAVAEKAKEKEEEDTELDLDEMLPGM